MLKLQTPGADFSVSREAIEQNIAALSSEICIVFRECCRYPLSSIWHCGGFRIEANELVQRAANGAVSFDNFLRY